MTDKLDITLKIGGVAMSLNIDRSEEELLRQVAKQVNHAYTKYSELFPDSSPRELLAKVTLLFAKGFVSLQQQNQRLDAELQQFDQSLSDMLGS